MSIFSDNDLPGHESMTPNPDDVKALIANVEAAMERAYRDGYAQGSKDTAARMMRAVANIDHLPGAPAREPKKTMTPTRMSPPRVGLDGAPRAFQYGTVIGAFRRAILASPTTGITTDELIDYCARHGVEITRNQVRDTIKRLTNGEEIERKHGAYFPGPRLKHEAPAAAASGPEPEDKLI